MIDTVNLGLDLIITENKVKTYYFIYCNPIVCMRISVAPNILNRKPSRSRVRDGFGTIYSFLQEFREIQIYIERDFRLT
jgi:hypothetical protein